MCTVTVVPYRRGFRMMCNRDERRQRPRACPPEIHDDDGLMARYPIDPVSGGTWIGVNHAGVAVALLNRAPALAAHEPVRSRGVIVPRLLACASLCGAIAEVRRLDVQQFAPFSVVMVQDGHMSVADSDGRGLTVSTAPLSMPLLLTSSSLGDALVDGPRRRLFDSLVLGSRDRLTAQRRFHRHQWRTRPEISVRMERADARSVSLTMVDVRGAETRLEYFELRDRGCWPAPGVQAA